MMAILDPALSLTLFTHPFQIALMVITFGSLGLLAGTVRRLEHTARHIAQVLDLHSQLQSRPIAAPERGVNDPVEQLSAVEVKTPDPVSEEANVFRRDGEVWTLCFEGQVLRLRDAKGLHYIATLLRQPEIEIHALELAGLHGADAMPVGDAGEVIDRRARDAYRRRLDNLRDEAEEADRFNDLGRAAKAREEMEAIARELSAAFGLGGQSRRAASCAERARLMVTQRIKASLRKIAAESPSLSRHFASSIQTGLFCCYEPKEPVFWNVS